ncbi:MAG: hypothetical protein HYX89_02245 [Chloroflexi bacterium]|nr:hypothetical protein [Chloroflexota bacterium]
MEEEYYCDFCGSQILDEDEIELIGSDIDISVICPSCLERARQAGVGPFASPETAVNLEIPPSGLAAEDDLPEEFIDL